MILCWRLTAEYFGWRRGLLDDALSTGLHWHRLAGGARAAAPLGGGHSRLDGRDVLAAAVPRELLARAARRLPAVGPQRPAQHRQDTSVRTAHNAQDSMSEHGGKRCVAKMAGLTLGGLCNEQGTDLQQF